MMTRIKSGLAAQLKALVVIPAAMFVFFFFAEITFAQDASRDLKKEVQGFWKNTDENTFGKFVNFKGDEIQILDENGEYKVMNFELMDADDREVQNYFQDHKIPKIFKNPEEVSEMLLISKNTKTPVFINVKGDKMTVQWSWGIEACTYQRFEVHNSLEFETKSMDKDFNPVSTSYYRISENPDNTFFILMNRKGEMLVDGERATFENLPSRISQIKLEGNPFIAAEKIPIVVVDASCKMANVHTLYHKMREINELRYILSVKPFDQKVPEVFYHNVGIPRLLPPKDAVLMEEEAVEKSGMKIIRVDLTKAETTPDWAAETFDKNIQADKKYVVLLSYQNSTVYKDYLSILDEFYQSIFAKRNQLAQDKYQLAYDDLPDAYQKEIRKSLPMIITERNVDMKEE